MLASGGIEAVLKGSRIGLPLIERDVTHTRVLLEVAHVKLDPLSGELLLLGLELEEFLAVDDGTYAPTPPPPPLAAAPEDSEIPAR